MGNKKFEFYRCRVTADGEWGEKGKVCTGIALLIRVNNHIQTFIPRWFTPLLDPLRLRVCPESLRTRCAYACGTLCAYGHATRMPAARFALTPVAYGGKPFGVRRGSLEPLSAHGEARL
ncbi:MAG: hypothetical protein KME57_29375 [Scytonema hyalinum WJT4-NPBG1]|nr:hypothetical protein [Scytonema hyalinum WJT4-NPBG1]